MKKWLFNPFVYIAGTHALVIGWGIMIISAFIAFYTGNHFDGALDVHSNGHPVHLPQTFFELFIDWSILVLTFYILGRIVSDTSFRFIDIAGTIALARWPMIFVVLVSFLPVPGLHSEKPSIDEMMKMISNPYFIIMTILILPLIVWVFALNYNAFSVSTNLKKGKAVITFIAGIIIAEVISKIVLEYTLIR
jgi:hypothetical protein